MVDVYVPVMRSRVRWCSTWRAGGFDAHIVKDFETTFADSSCVSCGACAQACPTSAISDIFESKAVVADKKVRTVCTYCGVGCNLEVAVADDKVKSIQAPYDAAVNQGHTCLKGRYAFFLLQPPGPFAHTHDQKKW